MKINILLFSLLIACLAACGGGNTPKGVAKDFYLAILARDFEKAKKLATPQSAQVIDMISEGPVSGEKPTDYKIISVDRISDEEANVILEYSIEGRKKEEKIHVKKIDGRWLVDARLAKK